MKWCLLKTKSIEYSGTRILRQLYPGPEDRGYHHAVLLRQHGQAGGLRQRRHAVLLPLQRAGGCHRHHAGRYGADRG